MNLAVNTASKYWPQKSNSAAERYCLHFQHLAWMFAKKPSLKFKKKKNLPLTVNLYLVS